MARISSCYDKACELLAARPHFRAQLAGKLARRNYPAAEIEQTLDRLERQGYLDDAAAARRFVGARAAGAGAGRRRLRAELERRGAAAEAVVAALGELPEDDLPAARAAAERWSAAHLPGGGAPAGRDAGRLARHLERKGFSRHAIVAVLAERGGSSSLLGDGES